MADPPLPMAWDGLQAWRVLDTAFGDGRRFLATWQAWRDDASRPHMLHYVAICAHGPDAENLHQTLASFPGLQDPADALLSQWFGLLPGFHRLVLEQGQVLLTLCIGELIPLLREQHFVADSVFLGPLNSPLTSSPLPTPESASWTLKAISRCCRRGTSLTAEVASGVAAEVLARNLRDKLQQCGFELQPPEASRPQPDSPGTTPHLVQGHFNPRWDLKNSRGGRPASAQPPGHCVVIGAGLAGASVAASLARRGWCVLVLDAGAAPAAGASGLPVGLAVPHNSPDDSPRSRLSRAGLRLTLEQVRGGLQRGEDFDDCGALERRLDGSAGLPDSWPAPGRDWSRPVAEEAVLGGLPPDDVALWHAQGAWIKPARLVRLWLSQPGVSFQPHARVGTITPGPQGWVIRDEAGLACATAPLVVIAAAGMTAHLLQGIQAATTPSQTLPATHALDAAKRLAGLREVSGQVSWGLHQPGDDRVEVADLADRALPQVPVNGSGSLIPAVPTSSGVAWFAGATYQPPGGANSGASVSSQHADNLHRLETLLPSCAALLRPRFAAGQVNAWLGTRCTTADRLPLVGPLHEPAIWISTGMGSRGLSYSVLCAELLAARLGAEPLPVEASLARLLQVAPVPRIHPGFT